MNFFSKSLLLVSIILISNILPAVVAPCFAQQRGKNKNLQAILKTFDSYYAYESSHIFLGQDYACLDQNGKPINKSGFLQLLVSGRFVPILTNETPQMNIYHLYNIPKSITPSIGQRVKQLGQQYKFYYSMEGKMEIPRLLTTPFREGNKSIPQHFDQANLLTE